MYASVSLEPHYEERNRVFCMDALHWLQAASLLCEDHKIRPEDGPLLTVYDPRREYAMEIRHRNSCFDVALFREARPAVRNSLTFTFYGEGWDRPEEEGLKGDEGRVMVRSSGNKQCDRPSFLKCMDPLDATVTADLGSRS